MKASVAGTIKVGPSTAGGTVQVEFDQLDSFALVNFNGSIVASPDQVNLTGGSFIARNVTVRVYGANT